MHSVSCANTYHDVTDLISHMMFKNKSLLYLEKGTYFLFDIKKFLNCALDGTFSEGIIT